MFSSSSDSSVNRNIKSHQWKFTFFSFLCHFWFVYFHKPKDSHQLLWKHRGSWCLINWMCCLSSVSKWLYGRVWALQTSRYLMQIFPPDRLSHSFISYPAIKVCLSELNLISEVDRHLKELHFCHAIGTTSIIEPCVWSFMSQFFDRTYYEPLCASLYHSSGDLCGSPCGMLCKYSILSPAFELRGLI